MPDDRIRRFRTEDGIYVQVARASSGDYLAEAQYSPFAGEKHDLLSKTPNWFQFADDPHEAATVVIEEAREHKQKARPTLLRDRIAHRLANLALHLASPWYRNMIEGSIAYGLNAAARDQREGREPPNAQQEAKHA